eukprot:353763-Chlamydomonas_euryale.AAC.4
MRLQIERRSRPPGLVRSSTFFAFQLGTMIEGLSAACHVRHVALLSEAKKAYGLVEAKCPTRCMAFRGKKTYGLVEAKRLHWSAWHRMTSTICLARFAPATCCLELPAFHTLPSTPCLVRSALPVFPLLPAALNCLPSLLCLPHPALYDLPCPFCPCYLLP